MRVQFTRGYESVFQKCLFNWEYSSCESQGRPTGVHLRFFTVIQGSATPHPGLTCRRTSGAWFVIPQIAFQFTSAHIQGTKNSAIGFCILNWHAMIQPPAAKHLPHSF
jgi:hypothetical protein